MQAIVMFIVTMFAGLISAAEFVHAGNAKAGADKKAFVLAQLETLLAGTPPTISGVNATVMSVVFSVLRWLVPTFGGQVIDFIVTKLNANSFFVKIESYLATALDLLSNTVATTPAPAQAS